MKTQNVSTPNLNNYVLAVFGVWILFVASFPIAYMRVSRSEKYEGQPFKSLSWEEGQRSK